MWCYNSRAEIGASVLASSRRGVPTFRSVPRQRGAAAVPLVLTCVCLHGCEFPGSGTPGLAGPGGDQGAGNWEEAMAARFSGLRILRC